MIKEYRIPVPVTTQEFQIGQLYSIAEASKASTSGGEGIEVLVNEPYTDEEGRSGQFTHKVFHLKDKVPTVIRMLAPNGALEVHEKAWNAFPYCKTQMTNVFMKDNFKMTVETMHVNDDNGFSDNVHNLEASALKKREVIMIDIANDPIDPKEYREDEDPKLVKSQKTGRGPLVDAGWQKNAKPIMTAYKLVSIEFKWLGLQGQVEALIHRILRGVFTKIHRQIFCWIDRWYGLTLNDIRRIEEETKAQLNELLHKEEQAKTAQV